MCTFGTILFIITFFSFLKINCLKKQHLKKKKKTKVLKKLYLKKKCRFKTRCHFILYDNVKAYKISGDIDIDGIQNRLTMN